MNERNVLIAKKQLNTVIGKTLIVMRKYFARNDGRLFAYFTEISLYCIRGPPVSEFENEKSNFGDRRIF